MKMELKGEQMRQIRVEAKGISLERTLLCGQAFRWRKHRDGFLGVVGSNPLFISQSDDTLELSCDETQVDFWYRYFALDRDYSQLEALLLSDCATAPCLDYSRGIRILRQEPFEALVSFILSANNNFSRICGIVENICRAFGESIEFEDGKLYTFPLPQILSEATAQDLVRLGAGYRAPYIVQTAKRIAEGYDLHTLKQLPFEQVKKELLSFSGVGPKVAECIMLFSLGFDEAFPVDVWVNRVVEYLYPGEDGHKAAKYAAERFDTWAGAAQQYLFHYARQVGLGKKNGKLKERNAL